jgi:hypothetical protein
VIEGRGRGKEEEWEALGATVETNSQMLLRIMTVGQGKLLK